mmetsp:Transcript_41782/g.70562  ORF Transcript_41782/g.70562 Transcript_41782/m.70562 type:complete len:203 (+) Transcript_41782:217-825(+)
MLCYAVVWQGGLCGGTTPHFVRQRTRFGRHQDLGYCLSCSSSCTWMAFLWASSGDRRKYALFFAIAGTKEASVLRAFAANLSGKRLSCWWVCVNFVRLSARRRATWGAGGCCGRGCCGSGCCGGGGGCVMYACACKKIHSSPPPSCCNCSPYIVSKERCKAVSVVDLYLIPMMLSLKRLGWAGRSQGCRLKGPSGASGKTCA